MTTPKPLTELTTPELERLVREKQGWRTKIRNDQLKHRWVLMNASGVVLTDWCLSEDEAWSKAYLDKEVAFTDTDWLALLNGLHPALIMDVLEYAKILHGKTEDSAGELLKRATLIAYLEHAT